MRYRGFVIDRMDGENNHQTALKKNWEDAHHAAERLAKRLGVYQSQRWSIGVIEEKSK